MYNNICLSTNYKYLFKFSYAYIYMYSWYIETRVFSIKTEH